MSLNLLLEATPLDQGVPTTIRMCSASAGANGVQTDGEEWLPIIESYPSLSFNNSSGNNEPGPFTIALGTVSFRLGSAYGNLHWNKLTWPFADFTLWIGEAGKPFSEYQQIATGYLSGLSRKENTAQLALRTVEGQLDTGALSKRFAGTGAAEGSLERKGVFKPRLHGYCLNVEPVEVDRALLVYQVNGYGAVENIETVYEFAQSLAAKKADVANWAALAAYPLVPGEWISCNALGLFRLGGRPDKKLTADVKGAAVTGTAPTTAAGIIAQLLGEAGVSPARIGDLSVLNYPWCVYLTDDTSIADLIKQAALDVGGYVFPDRFGVWQAGRHRGSKTPVEARLDRTSEPLIQTINELPVADPVWKVEFGHSRCWSVHSLNDVSPALQELEGKVAAQDEVLEGIQDLTDEAAANAASALAEVTEQVADGLLNRSDKRGTVERLERERVIHNKLEGEYLAYEVAGLWDVYHEEFVTLETYLNGLVPSIFDNSANTPVDRDTHLLIWRSYERAKQDLLNGITTRTSKVAEYPLVQGAPQNLTDLDPVSGTKLDGVQDGADVTNDVLESSRFYLAETIDRIGTELRSRFDPIFWTTNFPNTMMASVRHTEPAELSLDAVFHERGHLAGLIWESTDTLDHPTTAYDTNRDYRNCQLRFRLRLTGDIQDLSETNGPVLTLEGRDAANTPKSWFVRLGNCVVDGTARDATINLDFNNLPGGFYGTDSVYAGDVDRMFISLVPDAFIEGSTDRLDAPVEGGMVLSDIVVSGTNSTLTCGLGPGGLNPVRMTNGYDDTYNVTPNRIVRNLDLLGYEAEFNHYVGMSHYFRWSWSRAENRYVAQDVVQPLNMPCRLWHESLAALLRESNRELIISLSYEMLNSFAPAAWRQLDSTGAPALTGWEPPSSLFSPCNPAAMGYLKKVARELCGIASDAGLPVRFQVGEPWYWIDYRTGTPCFYDPSTVAAWTTEKGSAPPTITSMKSVMSEEQLAYLDWLGSKLATSILDLHEAVRADQPSMVAYVLLYLPQLLNAETPEAHRVNMPRALAYPALDVLQLEDYDFVITNRLDLSATGRRTAERVLGYPRSRQEYFAGFALYKDAGAIWRASTNAMACAYELGVSPVYIWAYTQVMRDGYVPRLKAAPPLSMSDLRDVRTAKPPTGDGEVLTYDLAREVWEPGKPWLADIPASTPPTPVTTSTNALIPTLNEPWINYGGGFGGARYYKNAVGLVTLEGLVQAPEDALTSDVVLFTLLPGYRPADVLVFGCWSGGGAYRLDIKPNGDVILQGGNTAFSSISGVQFYAPASAES